MRPPGAEIVDAGGAFVIPGGIDPHTHMEMPFMGTVACEDFFSGTASALAGGTTMMIDLCLPSPQQSLTEGLDQWRSGPRKPAPTTASTSPSPGGRAHPQQMAECWTAASTASSTSWRTKVRSWSTTRSCSRASRAAASWAPCRWSTPRTASAVFLLQQQLLAQGITGPEGHALSRPPHVEAEAVDRAIMHGQDHSACRSTSSTPPAARPPKPSPAPAPTGQRVFGEPLAQYLVLDESVY